MERFLVSEVSSILNYIYVSGDTDRDKLLELGYKLIKENANEKLYVFQNKSTANFSADDLSDIGYVLSDIITF